MEYYEAYLDEDLDDDYGEGYDDAYDEDYDDAYDESSDESADFGEARRTKSQRQARRRKRQESRRRPFSRKAKKPSGKPATSGAVQGAFQNVGQDINALQKKTKVEQTRLANSQMNDLIAMALFRPKLVPIAATEDVRQITYKLEDNLLAPLVVKLVGSMDGISTSTDYKRFLPLVAGFLVAPNTFNDLGLGSKDLKASDGSFFTNLTKNPALILLIAFVIMNMNKSK
jgi:hypothetical protein